MACKLGDLGLGGAATSTAIQEGKMTDKDTLKAMLERAKIPYTEEEGQIQIEAGYYRFFSVFDFDEDGTLASIAAYED